MILLLMDVVLRGFVKDVNTGEPLSYAGVYVKGKDIGTYTDERGYFLLKGISLGKEAVEVSHIGYETKTLHIELRQNKTIVVELKPVAIEMKTVRVSAVKERFKNEVDISRVEFTSRDLNALPAFGEADIIRSLQNLPGVVTVHDFSNKIYIRGGSPDENLVYLDGITIYNPSGHLMMLVSSFNPDAINSVEMYAGVYPSRFGDRLSSVINIKTKQGNTKRLRGELSQSLLSTKVFVESPINSKLSYFISYRRTYFDIVTLAMSKVFNDKSMYVPYYFYDFIGKINYAINKNTLLTFTAYSSEDLMDFKREPNTEESSYTIWRLGWFNRGISSNLFTYLNPYISFNLTLAYSQFFTDRNSSVWEVDGTDSTHINFFNHVQDITIKPDFVLRLSSQTSVLFGTDAKYIMFDFLDKDYERGIDYETDSIVDSVVVSADTAGTFIVPFYGEIKQRFFKRFLVDAGARFIYVSILERTFINPSISLKYFITDYFTFNVGSGRYNQFFYTLNSQEVFTDIYNLWALIKSQPVPTSIHYVAGVERLFPSVRFRIEAFYKDYKNLRMVEPVNSSDRLYINEFFFDFEENDLLKVNGYAFGLEFFLKGDFKYFKGWVSYSFQKTRRELWGSDYAPSFDREHKFNVVLNKSFGKNMITLRWILSSGIPTELLLKRKTYRYDPETDSVSTDRVPGVRPILPQDRIPAYHRLDIHFERGFSMFKHKSTFFIDIINAYWQRNIIMYVTRVDTETKRVKKIGVYSMPFMILTAGVKVSL